MRRRTTTVPRRHEQATRPLREQIEASRQAAQQRTALRVPEVVEDSRRSLAMRVAAREENERAREQRERDRQRREAGRRRQERDQVVQLDAARALHETEREARHCQERERAEEVITHLRRSRDRDATDNDMAIETFCNGDASAVRALIESGVSVTSRLNGGGTALHHAVSNGNCQAVACLLDLKAPVDARSHSWTPLHHACARASKISVVQLLVDAQADVNAKSSGGLTPLHHAVKGKRFKLCELLLANNANPSMKNELGVSPLSMPACSEIKNLLHHAATRLNLPLPKRKPAERTRKGSQLLRPGGLMSIVERVHFECSREVDRAPGACTWVAAL